MLAEILVLAVFPALLMAAACWDIASYTIPNAIPLALVAAFAVFAIAVHLSPGMLGWHALAGLAGLVLGFLLFAFNFVGGGDAKLFAATALMLGFRDLMDYALFASILGGALTLGILAMRRVPLPRSLTGQGWIMRLHDEKQGIPYGVALALAAVAVLPDSGIFHIAASA